jgi:hypothetical protein
MRVVRTMTSTGTRTAANATSKIIKAKTKHVNAKNRNHEGKD